MPSRVGSLLDRERFHCTRGIYVSKYLTICLSFFYLYSYINMSIVQAQVCLHSSHKLQYTFFMESPLYSLYVDI